MAGGQDVAGGCRAGLTARVYLAGPDVFLPDAEHWAGRKKSVCARYQLIGISPLDDLADEPAEWSTLPEWQRIALRNEAHIRSCAAVIANLTPFRSPSADVGTAYEIGFARALGRPVFAYSNVGDRFTRRTLDFATAHGGASASPGRIWRDADGMLVEQFGLTDNLMLEAAIHGSGGALALPETEAADRWADLATFERCVRLAAAALSA